MSPLFFLLTRSFKNSILKRLRRFKEPKYLLGMLAFLGYMSLMILPSTGRGRSTPTDTAPDVTIPETVATALVMVTVLMAWIFSDQSALAFSMAEANILFPAPLSRAALLRMKILTPQFGIVLSSVIFMIFRGRSQSLRLPCVFVGGVLALELAFLNRLAAALARVPRGVSGRPGIAAYVGRALAILVLVALGVSLRHLDLSTFPDRLGEHLKACVSLPPASWVLLPFRTMIQPALAQTPGELLRALPIPLGVLVAYYLWIVHGGVVFEEAALGASEARKKKLELFSRTGAITAQKPAAPAPLPLAPTGSPLLGLAWKNYIAITRTPMKRLLVLLAVLLAGAAWIARTPETARMAAPIAGVAVALASMMSFMAPDMLRQDLRTSLRGADFLKSLPLRGWTVVLGEIISPVLVTLATQAVFLSIAALLLGVKDEALEKLTPALRGSGLAALLIFLGPVDLLLFVIANGAALCFPSWVPLGARAERGGEQFGVNILLQIARLLLLTAGLLPSVGVAAVTGIVLWNSLGAISLPLAALAGALVLAIEDGVLIWFLGGVFERFDPARELN